MVLVHAGAELVVEAMTEHVETKVSEIGLLDGDSDGDEYESTEGFMDVALWHISA